VVFTTAWGVALVLEAAVRAVLAVTLATGPFLAVAPVVGWSVIGSFLYFTITYVRGRRPSALAVGAAAERAG